MLVADGLVHVFMHHALLIDLGVMRATVSVYSRRR